MGTKYIQYIFGYNKINDHILYITKLNDSLQN